MVRLRNISVSQHLRLCENLSFGLNRWLVEGCCLNEKTKIGIAVLLTTAHD